MADTYTKRLILELLRGNEDTAHRILENIHTGQAMVMPVDVHLPAGEKAVGIEVLTDVESSGTKHAMAVLSTKRPGLVARLAKNNTTKTCKASGILCDPTTDIYSLSVGQDGFQLPAYAADQWVSNIVGSTIGYQHVHCTSISPGALTHDALECPAVPTGQGVIGGARDSTAVLRYAWGTDDYVDLGNYNDGKIFQMLLSQDLGDGSTPPDMAFIASSYPYGSLVRDADAAEAPAKFAANDSPAPEVFFQVARNGWSTPQLSGNADYWYVVTAPKEHFEEVTVGSAGNFKWDRVTCLTWHATWNGGASLPDEDKTFRFGGLYFGDPFDSYINSIGIIQHLAQDDEKITLSLDAPSSTDTHVEGVVIVGAYQGP